jgi:uncharacterized membrane protein
MSSKNELSTNRLEAFSDGVFAIAITLLILEIKIPSHEEIEHAGSLYDFLIHLWPSYFAYILSFLVIGIYWANHHAFISLFTKTDHIFNMLNVLLLMFIAFLPYPTALLGDFFTDESQQSTAVTFYALGIWLPSIAWYFIWLYGRKNLIDPRLSPTYLTGLNKLYLLSHLFYMVAFTISFFNAYISIGINIILALVYLMPPKKKEYIS